MHILTEHEKVSFMDIPWGQPYLTNFENQTLYEKQIPTLKPYIIGRHDKAMFISIPLRYLPSFWKIQSVLKKIRSPLINHIYSKWSGKENLYRHLRLSIPSLHFIWNYKLSKKCFRSPSHIYSYSAWKDKFLGHLFY